MATELRELLTDDDFSTMRLALEERIIYLLWIYREWSPEVNDTYSLYRKAGGYWTVEHFVEFARRLK